MAESLEEKVKRLEQIILQVEKKSQIARDILEIQNVMSRHSFLDAQGKNREQVMEIFSTKPDVQCIFHNTTIYKGLDTIIHYYCDNWEKKMRPRMLQQAKAIFPEIADTKENELVGFMKMHTACTPFIVVAGDGLTAKGTWESPGFVTAPGDGKFMAMWMWERFAVDFSKENGKWKIWHFCAMIQMATPYNKSWLETALEKREMKADPNAEKEPAVPVVINNPYDPRKLCGPCTPTFPLQPVPYETFSETFSYGQ
jgi:hypothetical protein